MMKSGAIVSNAVHMHEQLASQSKLCIVRSLVALVEADMSASSQQSTELFASKRLQTCAKGKGLAAYVRMCVGQTKWTSTVDVLGIRINSTALKQDGGSFRFR